MVNGTTMLIVSGFYNGINQCTPKVYSFDTANPNANWKQQDDLPISAGVSHAGFVSVGSKFYFCGGVSDSRICLLH